MPSLQIAVVAGTVLSVAAAGVGTYLSYQGQQEQAKNAQNIAAYNAAVQQQQSDFNARLAIRQAQINQSWNQTQQNQTAALDNQAAAVEARAQEEARRNMERQRRMIGAQRAAYAKAGVVMEGTPLAVLADTAGIFELQNQDIMYEANSKAAALRRQAELERAGLLMDSNVLSLNEAAAHASRRIGLDEANITRMQGKATAQGYRTASYGSLLSGVGSAAGDVGSYARWKSTN